MAQQTITFGNQQYDLNVPAELNAYLLAMHAALQVQNQTIQNLQAAPAQPQMTQQQFNTLIGAVAQQQAPVQAPINPITTARAGRDTTYEIFPPSAGHVDMKDFPSPQNFTGAKTDADPVRDRLAAYFQAKAKAYQYTKNRILYACSLLQQVERTKDWANLVRKAITLSLNNNNYYDSWQDWKDEFIRRNGLTNPAEYYFRRMIEYKQQPGQDCKSFTDGFENLRAKTTLDKLAAFFYLKANTRPRLRTTLIVNTGNPPQTYDDWVAALGRLQAQLDDVREINAGEQHRYQPPSGKKPYVPQGFGDPMNVDFVGQKKGKNPKKSKVQQKPPQKRQGAPRLAPHPTAPSSSRPNKPRSNECFLCGKEGHFARECGSKRAQWSETHIRQMAIAMEASLDLRSQAEDESDDDDDVLAQVQGEDDEDDDDDLITFEEPQDGDLLGQDF